MKVIAEAKKTIGLGCIKGDVHEHNAVGVKDNGTYYEVYIHENWQVRYKKGVWRITIE